MTVFIAWTGARVEDDLAGPWQEILVVADDLCFVVSGAIRPSVVDTSRGS